MITCELLAPVLKYKTRGTTGHLFLKYKTGDSFWSPVPKVQDPGQTISERKTAGTIAVAKYFQLPEQ